MESKMVITKTPFRVSFCGGGSDIADFYEKYGGCVLSSSINKYMYISIHPYFHPEYISLKYSQNELVNDICQIKHSILRCVLNEVDIRGVEIVSTADVPSGTGLGSSSSFTVGLLNAINAYQGKCISKKKLAEWACEIEIQKQGNPIGKQDQYAAAFGSMNFLTFHRNGKVTVEPLITKKETISRLEENLIMFYTGIKHNANMILGEQKENKSEQKEKNLIRMCELAKVMKRELENGNIENVGDILHESWMRKKELTQSISRIEIDNIYDKAIANGATGGKILGAGGGGFLLFYCEKEKQHKLADKLGLKKFDFEFEQDGSTVVYIGERY